MKRLLGIILAVVMLTAFPILSFASEETTFTYSEEAANKYTSLGVYSDIILSEETLNGGSLTRGEFAALMTFLFNVNPDGSEISEAPFTDVDIDEAIAPYIKAAKDYLKFYGFSDGTFSPNSPILLSQAIRAMLSNMGYDVRADLTGGYPNGYTRLANELNLISGISKGWNDEINLNDYFSLLRNVIECETLNITTVGDSISFGNNGETVLSLYHNIYTIKDILNANDITSLKGYSDTMGEKAVIGNTEVYSGEVSVLSLIGYDVKAYYRQLKNESMGTLVYIEKTNKNNVLTVAVDDIIKASGTLTNFVYRQSNKNTKSIPITSAMQVVVNGVAKPLYAKKDIYPDDGEVTFIDNNGDSKYDIISTFSVTDTMVLGSLTEYNEKFYIYDYSKPERSVVVRKNDSYYADVVKDGLKVDIRELKALDVLSIGQAPDGSVIIKATAQSFDGVITKTTNDKVIIGENEYEVSYVFDTVKTTSVFDDFEVGANMTFFIDYNGKIVAARKYKPEMNYGVILKLGRQSNAFDATIWLRVLATDGETYDYTLADKVMFNGSGKEAGDVYTALAANPGFDAGRDAGQALMTNNQYEDKEGVRQVIMYEKPEEGSNVITKLNSVTADGDLTYDGDFHITNYYDYYRGTFSYEAYPTSSTAVFILYDSDDNCIGKLGGYGPASQSVRSAYVYFYNRSDEDLSVQVVLEHRTGGATANQNPDQGTKSYVVESKVKALDADGNEVDALNLVYTDGSETKVYVSNKTNDTVKGVYDSAKVGDIVAFSSDTKGRLNGFKIAVQRARLHECGWASHFNNVHDETHDGTAFAIMQYPLVSGLGYVEKIIGSYVFFSMGEKEADQNNRVLRRKTLSNNNLGLIEVKKSDLDYINIVPDITVADIMPGDYIFIRTQSNDVATAWAIREID